MCIFSDDACDPYIRMEDRKCSHVSTYLSIPPFKRPLVCKLFSYALQFLTYRAGGNYTDLPLVYSAACIAFDPVSLSNNLRRTCHKQVLHLWINCIKTINVYVSIISHLRSPPKCTLIGIDRKYHNPGRPCIQIRFRLFAARLCLA